MINFGWRLEAILTQLLTKTRYARALILKGSLREVQAEERHHRPASVNMTFLLQY